MSTSRTIVTLKRILINVILRRNNNLPFFFYSVHLYDEPIEKPLGFSAPWFRPLVYEMCPNAFIDHLRVGELNAPLRHSCNLTGQCFRKIDLPVTCGSMSPATWRCIERYRQFIIGLSKASLPIQNLLSSLHLAFPFRSLFLSFSLSYARAGFLRKVNRDDCVVSYSRWGKSGSGVLDIAY